MDQQATVTTTQNFILLNVSIVSYVAILKIRIYYMYSYSIRR